MKTYRLYIMILVSTGIHLGALGFWNQKSQTIYVSTDQRSQTFNVALTEPLVPETPVSGKKSPLKIPIIKPRSAHTQTSVKSKTKSAKPLEKPLTKVTLTEFQPSSMLPEPPELPDLYDTKSKSISKIFALLNNDMVKELQSEFQARFKYPMMARKRGWQGKVVLALHINLQGNIADIAVKRSSGYKVLDHNAVKTFKAIGKLSPNLHDRIRTSHSFNIPIIYQLNGG